MVKWNKTTEVLNEYAKRLVDEYRNNLSQDNSFASGKLYNSITQRVEVGRTSFVIAIQLEEYWKYVENGRRAGAPMPPISAIERWIRVKPIIPQAYNGVVPSIKQLAYLIARSISIKGIPAKKGFKRAWDSIEDELRDALREAMVIDTKANIFQN